MVIVDSPASMHPTRSHDDLLAEWRQEEQADHQGWDFSHLVGRLSEEEPPWDFKGACRAVLTDATHVLDMGTGGGEYLLSLADFLPADTVATEGWEPNLPLARANLEAASVPVVRYDAGADTAMPFGDRRFDLILNRHEAFEASELFRVLEPGGVFLTQQVTGDDFAEAHEIFGAEVRYPEHTLDRVIRRLLAVGFRLDEREEWQGTSRFGDVGALVYYFKLVPWDVPDDFCVDNYADTLLRLHAQGPERCAPVTFTFRRFWLLATKPG